MKVGIIRKLLAFLLASIALFAHTEVVAQTTQTTPTITMYAKAHAVRVREQPSFQAPVRRFLLCGEAVQVSARTTNGFFVLADGGYVYSSLLGDLSSVSICAYPPKPFITGTLPYTTILRLYPFITAPIAFVLPQGSTITLTAQTTNGWYQVYYLGSYHYVSKTLVALP